jgi:hypothetical protein
MSSEETSKPGAPSASPGAEHPAADTVRRSAAAGFSHWVRGWWSIAALGSALSLLWAAYTYSNQQAEQRRQDFLQAYSLVSGDLGQSVVKSLTDAISPFYRKAPITDAAWNAARGCYDDLAAVEIDRRCLAGGSETPAAARLRLFSSLQRWLLTHVLVKDGQHDDYIHKYLAAANDLRFLYQYARTDPCNWVVVAFKFKKNAYDFWYYYPGAYDFSGPKIAPLPPPAETALLSETIEKEQQRRCLEGFTSIPNTVFDSVAAPLRRIF